MPLYPSVHLVPVPGISLGYNVLDEVGQHLGVVNEVRIEGQNVSITRSLRQVVIKPLIGDNLSVTIHGDILSIGYFG